MGMCEDGNCPECQENRRKEEARQEFNQYIRNSMGLNSFMSRIEEIIQKDKKKRLDAFDESCKKAIIK